MSKLYKNWTAHNLIGLQKLGSIFHDATLPPETVRG